MVTILSTRAVNRSHEVYAKNGPAKAPQMGQYLGRRFGTYNNIVWAIGSDNDPRTIRRELEALAEGLRATADLPRFAPRIQARTCFSTRPGWASA